MAKKIVLFLFMALCFMSIASVIKAVYIDNGFDENDYNTTAHVFNGTGLSWCMYKGKDKSTCENELGIYANDKLIIKWNREWERGGADEWIYPPYDARLSNEWNGMIPGGSGSVWKFKLVYDQGCYDYKIPTIEGTYCSPYGPWAVLMDQGIEKSIDSGLIQLTQGIPNGYGFLNK